MCEKNKESLNGFKYATGECESKIIKKLDDEILGNIKKYQIKSTALIIIGLLGVFLYTVIMKNGFIGAWLGVIAVIIIMDGVYVRMCYELESDKYLYLDTGSYCFEVMSVKINSIISKENIYQISNDENETCTDTFLVNDADKKYIETHRSDDFTLCKYFDRIEGETVYKIMVL